MEPAHHLFKQSTDYRIKESSLQGKLMRRRRKKESLVQRFSYPKTR